MPQALVSSLDITASAWGGGRDVSDDHPDISVHLLCILGGYFNVFDTNEHSMRFGMTKHSSPE